jgi:predicted transcriptional regulator
MELQILNTNTDFRVNEKTGEAYVSQTKLAEMCGVGQDTISKYITKTRHTLNLNEINQLREDSVELVIGYYAFDSQRPSTKALQTYRIMAKAGIRAYIYSQAGYELKAEKKDSELSLFDSLAAGFARMAQVEREQSEQKTELINLKQRTEAVEARQSAIIDQSSYYSVLAYAINNNHKITTGQASGISRRCGSLSKNLGYAVGTIVDPRFGTVKTYHESVLAEVFILKGYLE